jgi:hypothetical protein
MVENEFYQAIMEGRMPLRFEVEETPEGRFVARHDQFGIEVSAVADSAQMATQDVRDQVLAQVKTGDFHVKYA